MTVFRRAYSRDMRLMIIKRALLPLHLPALPSSSVKYVEEGFHSRKIIQFVETKVFSKHEILPEILFAKRTL